MLGKVNLKDIKSIYLHLVLHTAFKQLQRQEKTNLISPIPDPVTTLKKKDSQFLGLRFGELSVL